MHEEILSNQQKKLLPLIEKFSVNFGLVGGTAVASQIGHRRSIDFDLATLKSLNSQKIKETIRDGDKIEALLIDEVNEVTLVVSGVKLTFFKYPFSIDFSEKFADSISMPNLPTLAAMKAFALGRRAKWKDYVDLYFIFKKYSLEEIVEKARHLFKKEFNEKLFREQLAYFEDIDFSEKIDYMEAFRVDDENIKKSLRQISLQKCSKKS